MSPLAFADNFSASDGRGLESDVSEATRADARMYFSLLDRRSRLGQPDPMIIPVVNAVWATLRERIRRRCRTPNHDPDAVVELPEHGDPAHVRIISKLMLSALAEVFGAPLMDKERLSRIAAAHDVFSWGGVYRRPTESVVERSNMTPDGAAIFMFPEFAHLAMAMGFDVEDWTALLPILTRMPALYLRAHELAESEFKPRPFGEYGHPPFKAVCEPELARHAARLGRDFESLSQRDLANHLNQLLTSALVQEAA